MGSVSRIQRFCLHDGSGVRTTVFLQGCPMRCQWCANPETQPVTPVLLYHAAACLRCGRCAGVCPDGLIRLADQALRIDRNRCHACGLCVAACPSKALSLSGREMTAAEVMDVVMRDRDYYDTSGGGVTFSGGEATLQPQFLLEMIELLRKANVHIALETAGGGGDEASFANIARLCDTILFDVKHLDREQHQRGTGLDNRRILRNLSTAAKTCPTVIRLPLIDGYNNDDGHLREVAALADGLSINRIELLPFHRLGATKYDGLGLSYRYGDTPPMSGEQSRRAAACLRQCFRGEVVVV